MGLTMGDPDVRPSSSGSSTPSPRLRTTSRSAATSTNTWPRRATAFLVAAAGRGLAAAECPARGSGGPLAVRGDAHGPAVHRRREPREALGPSAAAAAAAGLHRRPARRGRHQRARGRRLSADLPRPAPGARRPARRRARDPPIDRDDRGPIPRANLSLKLTSLTARFDAIHAEATAARRRAAPADPPDGPRVGAYVHVDMEQDARKGLTFALFKGVLIEPEFRDWPDVGSSSRRTCPRPRPTSLRSATGLRRGTPITVRLVKGAYWDYEVLLARQLGWPVPVFQRNGVGRLVRACSRFLWRIAIAPPGLRQPQCPEPRPRDRRGRALGVPESATRSRCCTAWATRSSGPPRAGATGSASTPLTARCCRGWPTWSAGCSKIRRTIRS